jgi:hypothetical protein
MGDFGGQTLELFFHRKNCEVALCHEGELKVQWRRLIEVAGAGK